MPRVVGIDPGTVSIDICGLDDGRLFLDCSIPTADALADPSVLIGLLEAAGRLDLIAGPSGYGLPLKAARDLSEADIRLAYLIAEGDSGGIGGLRSLMRAFAQSSLPVVLTPGVIHLPSVPAHRKVNRIDMGTADKLCAVVLAIREDAQQLGVEFREVSFVLLELGGAFTAAIAVDGGRIVDGIGGTSGPLGLRAAGALDGEVAYLASPFSKQALFGGGVASLAGAPDFDLRREPASAAERMAADAYIESAVKAVMALTASFADTRDSRQSGGSTGRTPSRTVLLSGRLARDARVQEAIAARLTRLLGHVDVRVLQGFAAVAKQAAQGAALVADGLAGGASAALIDHAGIREASGTVLDHLYFIAPSAARRRLGLNA
jgi:predicted butyrate kinase (DUF1464 family)